MTDPATRGFRGKRAPINGDALRQILAVKRITQTEAGARAGLSKWRISSFCRAGVRNMRLESAQRLAAALSVTVEDLGAATAPPIALVHGLPELSEGEQEIVDMYRSLPPRQKARALLAMEEIVLRHEQQQRESAQQADNRQDQP